MSIKGRQGVLNNAQWEHTIVIRYQTHCRTSKTSYFCWVNGDGYIETQNGWQNGPSLNQWNTVPCPIIIDTHQKTWFSTRSVVHFWAPCRGGSCWGERNADLVFQFLGRWVKDTFSRLLGWYFTRVFYSSYCSFQSPIIVSETFQLLLVASQLFYVNLDGCWWISPSFLQSISQSMVVNIPIYDSQHPLF